MDGRAVLVGFDASPAAERAVRWTAAETSLRGVPLLAKGTPPGALLESSTEAALIVIGARGAGGFDTLPVGSTAAHVPAHADRPVVVVPAHERRQSARIVVGVDGSPASEAAADPEGIKKQAKARFANAVEPHLTDNARDAMLLVVGDRGIGSSPRTLLGAVTRTLLHEAPSPVAVVHERDPNIEEPS